MLTLSRRLRMRLQYQRQCAMEPLSSTYLWQDSGSFRTMPLIPAARPLAEWGRVLLSTTRLGSRRRKANTKAIFYAVPDRGFNVNGTLNY
jgi:hypothetical protein